MTSERTEVFRQLSVDVDYLASALGEVVRELEGERLFALVERVRSMTKKLRAEQDPALKADIEALIRLPVE